MVFHKTYFAPQWSLWARIVSEILFFIFTIKNERVKCIHWYLFEYLWRQRVKRTGEDIFTSFLKLIAQKQTESEVTPVEDLPKVFFIYGSVQKIYAII